MTTETPLELTPDMETSLVDETGEIEIGDDGFTIGGSAEAEKPAKSDNDDTGEEGDEDTDEVVADDESEDGEEGRRGRSVPAKQRIAQLTAKQKEAERRADAAEARLAQIEARFAEKPEKKELEPDPDNPKPDPEDDKYPYGEASPDYAVDMAMYRIREEQRAKEAEASEGQRAQVEQQQIEQLAGKVKDITAQGVEKYGDEFESKVHGDDFDCPREVAVEIAKSAVGADVAWSLANDPREAALLTAEVASGNIVAASDRFGYLEGKHMTEAPKHPGSQHPDALARYAGQLRGYNEAAEQPTIAATNAPAPPTKRAKGGGASSKVNLDDPEAFDRALYGS